MDSEPIVRGFSRAAGTYDDYAQVQRTAAFKLIERTRAFVSESGVHPRDILDMGCGTGFYTSLLSNDYPGARIVAMDPSESMLDIARRRPLSSPVEFRCGQRPGAKEHFDLITSNSALQWSLDLAAQLMDLLARLHPNGLFTCTLFGPRTYRELSAALGAALGHPVCLPASRFADRKSLQHQLAGTFANATVTQIEYTQRFDTVRELLATIKKSGVRGEGATPPLYMTRGLIDRVEAAYRRLFGEVDATYHLLIGVGSAGNQNSQI